jgi:deaminated glutathione amidase
MKIAALQMVSEPSLEHNLEMAGNLIAQAASLDAELVALPEYFCFMGHQDTDKLALQERQGDGPIQAFLADAARQHQVWLVGGTLPLASSTAQRVRNSCLAYNPQGELVARYDKMHLFAFSNGREHYDEASVLEPGDHPVGFSFPSRDGDTWRVGLSVCYDLRFAALYHALQADLILVPSAFTHTTGQAHWEVLLRARAIENLAYVMAPAQGGVHTNGRHTWGHSMVVDSWGRIMQVLAQGSGLVVADISMAELHQHRQQLPAIGHRRAMPGSTEQRPMRP